MTYETTVASVAALLADPARATMLSALLDGRALPAGELAFACGVTPQTASAHLSKLLAGGLVAVETEGRHRYYRLSGAPVAEAIERLASLRPLEPARRRTLGPYGRELRFARRCYDHLAGQLGVALAHGLQQRKLIVAGADKRFDVTPDGCRWFHDVGVDTATLRPGRRGVGRQCLDWTERRHHLGGPLGVELMRVLCERGWLRRTRRSRAIQITPAGAGELRRLLGIDVLSLQSTDT